MLSHTNHLLFDPIRFVDGHGEEGEGGCIVFVLESSSLSVSTLVLSEYSFVYIANLLTLLY